MVGISFYLLPSSRRSRSRGRHVIMGYTALMLVTTTAWSASCFLSSYIHSLLPLRFVTAAIYAAWTLSEALASKTAAGSVTEFCSPINIVANLLRTLQVLQSDALVGSNFLIHTPEREAHISDRNRCGACTLSSTASGRGWRFRYRSSLGISVRFIIPLS
jgi:hypothetical protein